MTKYVGARYMPKFVGTYNATTEYEALSVVDNGLGTSYVSNKPVPAGTPLTDTEYWAVYGAVTGAILDLRNQISDINSDISTINTQIAADETKIKRNYLTTKNTVEGNLILNHNYVDSDGMPQGSCYVGNDRIVCYFQDYDGNTGLLRCYNLSTYTIEWSHSITAYHGNSITYKPSNNCIYICGAFDAGGIAINSIIEISMATPSVINRTFSLPTLATCISLSYDIEKDVFYGLENVGTTPGIDNILTIFNTDLDEVIGTTTLKKYPPIEHYGTSIQGTVLGQDGNVYILAYEEHNKYLALYDAENGDLLSITPLPSQINYCRATGECESLIYNYDTDSYYIGSVLTLTGTKNYYVNMFWEIGLYKGIAVQKPVPTNYAFGEQIDNRYHILIVIPAGDNLKPSWNIDLGLITVPNDAINFFKNDHSGGYLSVVRSHTYNGRTVTAQGLTLYNLQLSNFCGTIASADPSDPVILYNAYLDHTNIMFNRVNIAGHINPESTIHCNIYLAQSNVYFETCTFDDVTDGSPYHIWANEISNVYSYGGTYTGAATNYLTSNHSTVTIEP